MNTPIFRKVALDQLSSAEELDQLPGVTTPKGWLALVACGGLLVAVLLWSIFATIPQTVTGQGMVTSNSSDPRQLEAVFFLSIDDSSSVRPGMDVQLALASASEQEFGRVLGKVSAVADVPATEESMQRVLRNDAFVQMLVTQGAIIEVRVALAPDPATASGYRWSSSRGRDRTFRPGTPGTATITIARQRPVRLIIP